MEGFFFWLSWSHRRRPKNLHASVAVPPALVRVPSQRPLAPSVTSVTWVANDRVIIGYIRVFLIHLENTNTLMNIKTLLVVNMFNFILLSFKFVNWNRDLNY